MNVKNLQASKYQRSTARLILRTRVENMFFDQSDILG